MTIYVLFRGSEIIDKIDVITIKDARRELQLRNKNIEGCIIGRINSYHEVKE